MILGELTIGLIIDGKQTVVIPYALIHQAWASLSDNSQARILLQQWTTSQTSIESSELEQLLQSMLEEVFSCTTDDGLSLLRQLPMDQPGRLAGSDRIPSREIEAATSFALALVHMRSLHTNLGGVYSSFDQNTGAAHAL